MAWQDEQSPWGKGGRTPSPEDFIAEFEFWSGGGSGADALWFYMYSDDSTVLSEDDSGYEGYLIAFDEYTNEIDLGYGGTSLESVEETELDNSTWRSAKIVKSGEQIEVYLDGSLKINYTDNNTRDISGSRYFGWGARTGASTNYHRIRNVNVYTGAITTKVLDSNYTTVGENWSVTVTPSYVGEKGESVMSNNLTIVSDNPPNVSLVSPIDSYFDDSSFIANVTFECNATDDSSLANMSLYITDKENSSFGLYSTANISEKVNSSSWTLGLENGDYTWSCVAYDVAGQMDWADSNRSLKINYTSTIDAVVLNSSLGTNFTTENLTAYAINVTPDDAKVVYDWIVNGTSWKYIDMPMSGGDFCLGDVCEFANSLNGTIKGVVEYDLDGYDGQGSYVFRESGNISLETSLSEITEEITIAVRAKSLNVTVYNRSITLTNSDSEKTDYDVLLNLDTESLVDEYKMLSDCSDLEFYNSTGDAVEFWIEGGCNTENTLVWINMPVLPAGDTVIEMRYGNFSKENSEEEFSGEFIVMTEGSCPDGWTRVSELDNRFPKISTSYGTTGGNDAHSHIFSGTLSTSTDKVGGGSGNDESYASAKEHNHDWSITDSEVALPPYETMVYCAKDSLDIFTGAVSIFNTTSMPDGWTAYSELNDNQYFARGSDTFGATGGSLTHTHHVQGNSDQQSAQMDTNDNNDVNAASTDHKHSIEFTSGTASSLPTYVEIVYGQVNSTESLPGEGGIFITSAEPPIGYTQITSYNNRFIRGGTNYGATGGSSSHTHTYSGGTTGGPTRTNPINGGWAYDDAASTSHTHTWSSGTSDGTTLDPAYMTVLLYQRKTSDAVISVGEEEIYMNSKSYTNGTIAAKQDSHGIYYNNKTLEIQLNGNSIQTALGMEDWTYIVMTYNGANLSLYLDGELNDTLEFSENISVDSGNFIIGDDFSGAIEDVVVWNRSLSAEQIDALYNNRTDLIVSQETVEGEKWSVGVIPIYKTIVGDGVYSDNLTVLKYSSIRNVSVINIDNETIHFSNSSGFVNNTGALVRNTNSTLDVTIVNQTIIDKVWIVIWEDVIGGVVKFFGWFYQIADNVWSIDLNLNETFTDGEYNYTIYVNDTDGNEENFSSTFNVSGPYIDNVYLESDLQGNTTIENITAYVKAVPNASKVIYDWRVDGDSMALLNLPMDGGSNNTWSKDYSTNSANGTVNSDVVYVSSGGHDGNGAYNFTGGNSNSISLPNSFDIDGNFTMCFWMNQQDFHTDDAVIFAKRGSWSESDMRFQVVYDQALGTWSYGSPVGVYNSDAIEGPIFNNGEWYHVCLQHDYENEFRLYVNGSLVDSGVGFTYGTGSSATTLIGKAYDDNDNYYRGLLDEFLIYDRLLSSEQINTIYENKTDLIVSEETNIEENWSVAVTPIYEGEAGITSLSSNMTITKIPQIINLILESESGENVTTDNLLISGVTVPLDADLIYDWRLNGSSIALLNMPFEGENDSVNTTMDYSSYNTTIRKGLTATSDDPIFNATGGHDGGGAIYFAEGNNDEKLIIASDLDSYHLGSMTDEMTVSMWIYPDDLSGTFNVIYQEGNSDTERWHLMIGEDENISIVDDIDNAGNFMVSNKTIVINTWYYVVVVASGQNWKAYVDGELVLDEESLDGGIQNMDHANARHYFGLRKFSGDYDYEFRGYLDDVLIFNESLSAEQIEAIYNNGSSVLDSNWTNVGDVWQVSSTPVYEGVIGDTKLSNNLTIVSPFIDAVILNSSLGTNLTSEDLIAYPINVTPVNSNITYVWYNNSVNVLNTTGNSTTGNVLFSGNTSAGENWSVAVIPIYGASVGESVMSNNITILELTIPIYTNFNVSYGTTNFSNMSEWDNLENVVLATQYGLINWSGSLINATGMNYDMNVKIGEVFVSANAVGLDSTHNVSTNITLNNASCENPVVYYTSGFYTTNRTEIIEVGQVCNSTTSPACTNIVCDSGTHTLSFTAPHFSSYASNAYSNLSIWDEDDEDMPYANKSLGVSDSIMFFANYTNITGGAIMNATCQIWFNDTDSWNDMNFNDSVDLYNYSRDFNLTGTYLWNISCEKAGFGTLSLQDTINITDIQAPQIYDFKPFSNSTYNEIYNVSESIEIALNITDNSNAEEVIVYANVTMPNGTISRVNLTNVSAITNSILDKFNGSYIIPNVTGRYNITYVAYDLNGNYNTSITSFFVGQDLIPPKVFNIVPVANSSYNVSDTIEIGANVTDNILVDSAYINLTLPNTTVLQYSLNNISIWYNTSYTIANLTGQYNITFIANDSSGNINSTVTSFFVGEDHIAPSVLEIIPFNVTKTVNTTIEVSVNVSDNVEIDSVIMNIVYPNTTSVNLTLNNNSELISNEVVKFNASFDVPFIVDRYNVTVYANDSSGNVNSTETSFFIGGDGTAPDVFDLMPVANTAYNVSDTIEVGANVTDNVVVDVVLANITMPNGTITQLILNNTNTALDWFNRSYTIPNSTGRYNVTFIANDSSGNVNLTEITFFVGEDGIAPNVVDLVPVSNSSYNVSDTIEIGANVSDAIGVDSVYVNITLPNSTVIQKVLSNISNWYNTSYTIANLTGQYNVTFIANDSSGNVNLTSTTFFVGVDPINPKVFAILPAPGTVITAPEMVEIAANITDNVLVDSVYVNVTYPAPNNSVVTLALINVSDRYNVSFNATIDGGYSVVFFANDSSGNVNSSETTYFGSTVILSDVVFSNESSFDYANVFNESEIVYDENLTYIAANCTSNLEAIETVRFLLFNVEDNMTYFNESYDYNNSARYVVNSNYQIRDSGNWTFYVTCNTQNYTLTENKTFEIDWGNLTLKWINPLIDTSVQKNAFTTFSVNTSCSGGECGIVNVTLDPEEVVCENRTICENVSVGQNCVNETVSTCNENCSEIFEEVCNISEVCSVINLNETDDNSNEESGSESTENNNTTSLENNQTETSNNESVATEPETKLVGEEFEEGELLKTEQGKDLGKKTEDETEYETYFLEMNQTNEDFKIVFYHDYNGSLPIYVKGNVSYELDKNESNSLENVTLIVQLVEGILPQFELHVGEESEVFSFGKVIPVVELKSGNYTLIDRDDLKLDVQVEFDSESILLRGLENETNINVTLGTNSQEDVSSSIIAVPTLNVENATIILKKTKAMNSIIMCDDLDFNYETLECSDWKYANVDFALDNETGTIEFNVEHFTAYAGGNLTAGETATLDIWDYNDVLMPNASTGTNSVKVANETIEFFANYYLAKNGTKISDGNCSIVFSDNPSNILDMDYNSTYDYYLYERNFSSNGLYSYTINCTHSSYTNLSASDSIVIAQYNNETKGAISTTVGDVPFYTISNNPHNVSLRGGESQQLDWSVNATGIINKIYEFFAEAVGNYITSTNTSSLNIQITANDTASPVFTSVVATPGAVINGSSVTINANVEDGIQVDSIWGNITSPAGYVTNFSSVPYIFTNTTEIGRYNVTYFVNDSSGNVASTTNSFDVGTNLTTTINVSVDVAVDVDATNDTSFTFKLVHPDNGDVIYEKTSNESFIASVPNIKYDLLIVDAFNGTMNLTLEKVNLSANLNSSIKLDKHKDISGYLVTYGIDTDYSFNISEVVFGYWETGYTNEDNLQLWKCSNYDFDNRVCTSNSADVTNSATQNKAAHYFSYSTTSFSGFSIKEYIAPTTTDTRRSPRGSSSCTYNQNYDWNCSEWSECVGGVQTRECKERNNCGNSYGRPETERNCSNENPEQLFDITWNLDDKTISNSSELVGVITFESFGSVPTPVELTFIIFDSYGHEVYRSKGSIIVTTKEVMRWKFAEQELQDLPKGNYIAVLETLYNENVSDKFEQKFEINEKNNFLNFVYWIAGILLGIIVFILLIRFIRRLKKPKKVKTIKYYEWEKRQEDKLLNKDFKRIHEFRVESHKGLFSTIKRILRRAERRLKE